jgi:hypothetical protein
MNEGYIYDEDADELNEDYENEEDANEEDENEYAENEDYENEDYENDNDEFEGCYDEDEDEGMTIKYNDNLKIL